MDITLYPEEVYRLYARISGSYYVNMVFSAFAVDDLRPDLIEQAKRRYFGKLALRTNPAPV